MDVRDVLMVYDCYSLFVLLILTTRMIGQSNPFYLFCLIAVVLLAVDGVDG